MGWDLGARAPQDRPAAAVGGNRSRTLSSTEPAPPTDRALPTLEVVVNVSEGRDLRLIAEFADACGAALLDVHVDADHHRSVFTLADDPVGAATATRRLAKAAATRIDMTRHAGVHPRLGAIDVVPFVAYGGLDPTIALEQRDAFGEWLGGQGVPCFLYGPERTLPEIRRKAFTQLRPDFGPPEPHPQLGATCVGARPPLVAYNLLVRASLTDARNVAARLRTPTVRALAFQVSDDVQVSFNLVDPGTADPAAVYDAVAAELLVIRSELVGLVPAVVLNRVPASRWEQLDLGPDRTIEARLAASRPA